MGPTPGGPTSAIFATIYGVCSDPSYQNEQYHISITIQNMSNRKTLWDSPINFISIFLIFFFIARCDVMNIHIHVPYITTLANMYGRFTALWSGLSRQIEPRYCFLRTKDCKKKRQRIQCNMSPTMSF